MTTGIYQLVFKGTDKVYIGQSIDIEHRYKGHISCLQLGKGVSKLQNAYNIY